MKELRAITLYQPYAWAMATINPATGLPFKRIETRSWATNHRGPLAIHAAKSTPPAMRDAALADKRIRFAMSEVDATFSSMPRSQVLCIVNIIGVVPMKELWKANEIMERKIDATEFSFGDYSDGRFAWITDGKPELVIDPGPTKGAQGIWKWVRGGGRKA